MAPAKGGQHARELAAGRGRGDEESGKAILRRRTKKGAKAVGGLGEFHAGKGGGDD